MSNTLAENDYNKMNVSFSIVVPTHNRPDFLREALSSIVCQDYPDWEVVVVDDGSMPPVQDDALRELVGSRYRLIRHDKAKGIAAAKNAGVIAAGGDVVMHLDDDDLLHHDALSKINAAYTNFPDLECLYVNVKPFGAFAAGTEENQTAALSKLLSRAGGPEASGVVFFIDTLFVSLLKSVPLALQRPVARKSLWLRVGMLREGSYMPEPEWSIKCALLSKPALLLDYVYLARMDGQNSVSSPVLIQKHREAAIDIRYSLISWVRSDPFLRLHYGEIRKSLSDVYFDQAYNRQINGNVLSAWKPLASSFFIRPEWRKIKFGIKLIISHFYK